MSRAYFDYITSRLGVYKVARYEGICVAREKEIPYTFVYTADGECKYRDGTVEPVSLTCPMMCRKYVDEKHSYEFVDIWFPNRNEDLTFSMKDFGKYFLLLQDWVER